MVEKKHIACFAVFVFLSMAPGSITMGFSPALRALSPVREPVWLLGAYLGLLSLISRALSLPPGASFSEMEVAASPRQGMSLPRARDFSNRQDMVSYVSTGTERLGLLPNEADSISSSLSCRSARDEKG